MAKMSVSDQLDRILMEYVDDLNKAAAEITNKTARLLVAELKRTSPKGRPKYYEGWTVKRGTGFGGSVTVTVYNATHPGLTHLLEKGHGNAKAKPHIKPAEEKYKEEYIRAMEEAARNAGR